MPKMYSSDGIVSALASYIKGKKIEIVRSSRGSPALIEGLKKHGAYVHEVQVYDITRPVAETQRKLIEAGLNNEIDVYVFTSAMTVRNFLRTAEDLGKKNEMIKMTNQKTVAALGNPTAEALRENGIHVDVIPERFTFRDVLDELEKRCGV
jgi:uroporphyrinogen-III synthase